MLKHLTNLGLGGNQFTGSVPTELAGLKQLTTLGLQDNPHLTGLLPAFDFANITDCCRMDADVFTCPLPAHADKCVGGPACGGAKVYPRPTCIPACNGTSSALTANDCSAWQRFSRNPLYKEWAAQVKCGAKVHTDPCNCTFNNDKTGCTKGRITHLDMGSQAALQSKGMPVALLDLTGLSFLSLGTCGLGGSIPSSIGQLTGLAVLSLAANKLVGSIPSTIGKLTGLTYLNLGANSLVGSIPSSIGQLTGLNYLSSTRNKLVGSIPSTISMAT
jgi:hypothetical protein